MFFRWNNESAEALAQERCIEKSQEKVAMFFD